MSHKMTTLIILHTIKFV